MWVSRISTKPSSRCCEQNFRLDFSKVSNEARCIHIMQLESAWCTPRRSISIWRLSITHSYSCVKRCTARCRYREHRPIREQTEYSASSDGSKIYRSNWPSSRSSICMYHSNKSILYWLVESLEIMSSLTPPWMEFRLWMVSNSTFPENPAPPTLRSPKAASYGQTMNQA